MRPEKSQIVGQSIERVCDACIHDGPYVDHFLALGNKLLVNFSNGDMHVAEAAHAGLVDAEPSFCLGAPTPEQSQPESCIGVRIEGVLYSTTCVPDQRYQTYVLLADGRYLMSGLGFNYTELALDHFNRWYAQNKHANMLFDLWSNEPVNPFGDSAIGNGWSGWTVISPPTAQ